MALDKTQVQKIIKLKQMDEINRENGESGKSNASIAEEVLGNRAAESTVRRVWKSFKKEGEYRGVTLHSLKAENSQQEDKSYLPKILCLDIETAPILGAVWSLWKQNVGLNQINSDWFILSYAAKWVGNAPDDIYYDDMRGKVSSEDDTHLLDQLWKLLDEADICLTQNGVSFDLPRIRARMVLNGYKPFSSIKHIDTLQIAKKEFKFTSNKLAYMTDKLCTDYKKLDHGKFTGFALWSEMMKDNIEAFYECEEYNKYDVLSLEELYFKLAPWSSNHVNFNLYREDNEVICRCGSHNVKEEVGKFAYTGVSKFQQYRCLDCGATTRGRINLFSKEKRASLQMNIAG